MVGRLYVILAEKGRGVKMKEELNRFVTVVREAVVADLLEKEKRKESVIRRKGKYKKKLPNGYQDRKVYWLEKYGFVSVKNTDRYRILVHYKGIFVFVDLMGRIKVSRDMKEINALPYWKSIKKLAEDIMAGNRIITQKMGVIRMQERKLLDSYSTDGDEDLDEFRLAAQELSDEWEEERE